MLALLISACHPGGYTDSQWAQLTPEQREFETQKQAAQLDAQERKRVQKRNKAAADAERKSNQSPDYQLTTLGPSIPGVVGERITCVIRNPLVDMHPGWTQMKATAFTLSRGQQGTVGFISSDNRQRASVSSIYSSDGFTVTLCRSAVGTKDNDCDSMTASPLEFARGVGRSLTMPDILQGNLECTLVP